MVCLYGKTLERTALPEDCMLVRKDVGAYCASWGLYACTERRWSILRFLRIVCLYGKTLEHTALPEDCMLVRKDVGAYCASWGWYACTERRWSVLRFLRIVCLYGKTLEHTALPEDCMLVRNMLKSYVLKPFLRMWGRFCTWSKQQNYNFVGLIVRSAAARLLGLRGWLAGWLLWMLRVQAFCDRTVVQRSRTEGVYVLLSVIRCNNHRDIYSE
jgi:hypothetical protein